ncbi:MAG: hypothetical protein E4H17_04020 [Gemmatimonadales bacterium]|nr:MAG: hypothetical protein E4H17_04020 [Gemmatimonadales bacterium]
MMLTVEPDVVAGQQYTRVWWLYTNQAQAPVLIEPLVNVSVVSRDRRARKEQRAAPVAPSLILHKIENAKAVASIALAIGGSLKAAAASYDEAVNPPTITGPHGTATIRDPGRARNRTQAIADRTEDAIASTRYAYDLYARSVNSGVLRRNTVLPGDGVNGYVYLPCLLAGAVEYGHPERALLAHPENTEHLVVIRVGAYSDSVLFTPVAGE